MTKIVIEVPNMQQMIADAFAKEVQAMADRLIAEVIANPTLMYDYGVSANCEKSIHHKKDFKSAMRSSFEPQGLTCSYTGGGYGRSSYYRLRQED